MFTSTDLRRSLTAKVLLGLLLLGVFFATISITARLLGIRSSVLERERARALLVAEPMRFALESLAERHPDITTDTYRLQRLVEHLGRTEGTLGVAVTDSANRLLAAAGDVQALRGPGGDLPQRAQGLDRILTEPAPDGRALLVAVPLRRPAVGQAPPETFGALLIQYDMSGPVSERQRQGLRDLGVLSLGLLTMIVTVLVGLRTVILKPLASLAGQAAALGAGDFSARSGIAPPPGGGDEMERLAAGFDHMAARLEAAAEAQRSLHEELRASEARGRAVFEHASIAISQGDAQGRIVDANPAFLGLWGYTLEELRGVRWIDLTHPDDRAESLRQSARLLAGEIDGFALEKRYVRADGEIVWASVNVASMRDGRGQVEMLVLVAEDISPRKAAEQAEAEREELFQAMFEDNRSVQLLVDPVTAAVIDANNAAAEFYGYSREELRGPLSLISALPVELIRKNMDTARESGGVFQVPHRRKNGEVREIIASSGPFRVGGKTLLLSSIQDITDRLRAEEALKETEERLRLLIEVMDEGVVLTTPEGLLKYVNPAFAQMLGEEPTALEGRRYQDLLTPPCAADQPRRMAARRLGSREPYEARYLRRGDEVLARVTPFPLFSREGEYQGSCAIIRDITQTRAREQAEHLRRRRRSALLRLHEMHAASPRELLDYALEQALALTGSSAGYIYAYDDTRRQFILHSWSDGVMEQCSVLQKSTVYDLDSTGVWGDAVRLREPVLINDFAAPDPRRKGYPKGHVPLSRFLTLPVIRAGRVVAVVGVANKEAPYNEEDITQLRLFTDGLWSVLERQEALAQLSAVNERFHLAVRAGRIGLWDWDLASGAMHCDAFMEKSFGLSDLDRTGTPEDWLCRVHAQDRPRVREAMEIARATGTRFEQGFRIQRPDGEVLHLDCLAVSYLDPQNKPLRMVGVVIDVTRQRQAEDQVAESQRFLQTVIDTLPIPFACKDGEGRYLLVNQSFMRLFGVTREEVLGRSMDEFAPTGRAALHMAQDARLLSDPAAPALEYEVSTTTPEGDLRHWLVIKSRLPLEGGRTPGLAVITLDITERKRAEEALREERRRLSYVIEGTAVGTWEWNVQTGETVFNERWAQICGYTLEELAPVDFKTWERLAHPDDFEASGSHLARHFAGETAYYDCECRMRHKDGSWVWVHDRGRVASRTAEGEPLLMSGTHTDITERKRAEEALRRAKAAAEAASLAKAQFLANMSHEIRTPLGGVIGAAQLLARSPLSSDQLQLAEMAVESGRALLDIVNDILDFSKIEAGGLDLRLAPFGLRADMEAVAAPFRMLAEQRGLALGVEIDPSLPEFLVGDHGRLDQVLRNLLGNAVKFTDSGSITLEAALDQGCPAPQASACVRFTVRDTGIGIDPGFLPQIFESFSQADASYAKRHAGTGLGLAISRSLVERMGGSLAVESTPGRGSTFTFTLCLPRAAQGLLASEPPAPYFRASPAEDKPLKLQPLRLLLAEDNDISRTFLTRMLRDSGHAVTSVGTGLAVLDALSGEDFDLVLMDVQMPEMDGLSATWAIRQGQAGTRNASIPIVALTAYAQDEDRDRFLASGMDAYVPKPVEERGLLAAISRAMTVRADPAEAGGPPARSPSDLPPAAAEDAVLATPFDADYLVRAFGGRKDLLAELLAKFRQTSLPEIRNNLRQALAANDRATALRTAHKAKGTFGTVGARRAAQLAQAVEAASGLADGGIFRLRAKALLAEVDALDEHLRLGRPLTEGQPE